MFGESILLGLVVLLISYNLFIRIRRRLAKPNYTNKIVWITGASSGIGQYLNYEFNKLGARTIISARNTKELERVKSASPNPENVQVLPLDMTNYSQIQEVTAKFLAKLQSQGKHLDVVVQNAGVSMRCQFINYSFENHQGLFDVNVHGPFVHLKAVVPHLMKQKSGQIVGVTSLAGKLATAYRSSYAGSKHAFIGILNSLRSELKPYNVRVCNLMPGYIRTNLAKNAYSGAPGEKFGKTDLNIFEGMDPAVFAKQSVAGIYNNQNQFQVSKDWSPMIGQFFMGLCPDLAFWFLAKNAQKQRNAVLNAKDE